MARNKEPPKPLFALKHDFYASLDNTLQQAIMLMQAVDQALRLKQVGEIATPILKERLDAFRRSLMSDE